MGFGKDYEFIFEMDGDFSHNPDDLPKFLEAMEGQDLVLGSRYQNGIRVINWPLNRLLLSLCAAQYVKIITGMPITDLTGGFKCFRRRALKAIDLDQVQSNGYSFQIELTHKLWRQGMQISEVPVSSSPIVFKAPPRWSAALFGKRCGLSGDSGLKTDSAETPWFEAPGGLSRDSEWITFKQSTRERVGMQMDSPSG